MAKTEGKMPDGYTPVTAKQFSFVEDGIHLEGEFVGSREVTIKGKTATRHTFVVIQTNHPDFIEGETVGLLETIQLADVLMGAQKGERFWMKRTGKKRGGQGSFFEIEAGKKK